MVVTEWVSQVRVMQGIINRLVTREPMILESGFMIKGHYSFALLKIVSPLIPQDHFPDGPIRALPLQTATVRRATANR